MVWNPLGLAFQGRKRLASVSVPSGRDVEAGNSRVLERIGIVQPGLLPRMTESKMDRHPGVNKDG